MVAGVVQPPGRRHVRDVADRRLGRLGALRLHQAGRRATGALRPLPNWTADDVSNGVWGGSGTAVTVQSKHPAAATAFAQWFAEDQYIDQLDNAANMPFPASQKVLDDPRYVDASSDFLGGQKPGALYIALLRAVNPDWQFLPYQLYANTIYKDTFGQHVDGDHDLMAGLKAGRTRSLPTAPIRAST